MIARHWQASRIVAPDPPDAALGPTDTYATPAELAASLGSSSDAGTVERRNLALILATRWVAHRVGMSVTESALPVTVPAVTPIECPPAWREATIAAAVRFSRSSDVPWGVAGGLGDAAVYVSRSMPEVELMLLGQRVSFGVA